MKPSLLVVAISLTCAASVHAADYSPYPKAGVYDGSDKDFSRELTIRPDGKFDLEVTMKGKPGSNLRNGSGSGKFSDAPGGWDYREEGCYVTLKRAMGGMKLHVEGCAIAWGDVMFDGLFKLKGEGAAAPASSASAAAPATTAAMPTRKELLNQWTDLQVSKMAGKNVTAMARAMPADPKYAPAERYSQAAFVVDTSSNYAALPPGEQAKSPLQFISIPLPKQAPNEGLLFQVGCVAGKSNKVIAVNLTRADGKGSIQSSRHSAWMLDAALQLQEVKPASKVKCPEVSSEY